MYYKKISFDNFDLYYIKQTKFKTIRVSTIFVNEYDKKDISKEVLIREFLINTCNECKDEISMSKKNLELYEPNISINDVFGDLHSKWFSITFLNEKYTEKGMNKKTLEFYYNLIFEPNIENNSFEKVNFDLAKRKLKSNCKLDKEDSDYNAYYGAMTQIKDNIPMAIDTRLKESSIAKVNNKEACEYYLRRLKTAKVAVLVTGDIDDEFIKTIENCLKNRVYNNEYNNLKRYITTPVKKQREIIEDTTFNQSILYMIYKLNNMTERERLVVLPVFNNILGGSSSKLFINVREKNSLAYYARSMTVNIQNILYITAGIESKNYEKTVSVIKEEVDNMIKGNITDKEIDGAKESLYSSLLNIDDNQIQIIMDLIGVVKYDKIPYSELKEKYESVTKEELIELGKKLELDFIYLAKGVN